MPQAATEATIAQKGKVRALETTRQLAPTGKTRSGSW